MKPACALASVALFSTANALQLQSVQQPDSGEDDWQYLNLDKTEVAQRGSYCMDGSTPGYWYKEGTADGKWIISFEGGAMYCYDDQTCLEMMQKFQVEPTKVNLELYTGDFKEHSHVQLRKCDGGIFMSDTTATIGGKTMYLRGKRILDHTMDTLQKSHSFGSATEVMLTGGSGGGHSAFLLGDYVKGLMPASVKKYGAVPMSGWYASNTDKLEHVLELHQMHGAIAPGCAAAFPNEQHKCLEPENSYRYSKTPMFMVQMLDSQSLAGYFANNDTMSKSSKSAWDACLDTKITTHCDKDDATILEEYLEGLVSTVKSMPKYSQKGEGGFLSTCSKHVFYKEDEYHNYANNGATVEDAVSSWWKNMDHASAKWYLPCQLDVEHPSNMQCESSCSYDSGHTD